MVGFAVLALGVAYDHTQIYPAIEPRWMALRALAFAGVALWCLARIGTGFGPPRALSLPEWAVIVFAVVVLLSGIDPVDAYASRWQAVNVMACLAVFGLVIAVRSERWYRILFAATAATLGINGLLGILQYHGIGDAEIAGVLPQWAHLGTVVDHFAQLAPAAATFVNRNIGAAFAILALPIALGAFLLYRNMIAQWLSIGCFVLGSVFVVYAHARATWLAGLAVLFGAAVLCALHRPTRQLIAGRLGVGRTVAALLAAAAIGYLALQPTALRDRGGDIQKLRRDVAEQVATVADIGQGSTAMRLAHYLNGSRMALDNWIIGVGIGSFRAAYPPYHDAVVETPRTAYAPDRLFRHVHNDFLQAFIELGVVGGLAFLVFLFGSLGTGLRVLKRDHSEDRRIIVMACLAALAGLMVNALFSFPFQTPTAGLAWIVAGMILGVVALARDGDVQSKLSSTRFSKVMAIAASLGSVAIFLTVAADDLARRQSGVHLKWAWSRNFHGVELDQARADIDRAAAIHARSSLPQETRALVYLNQIGPDRPTPDQVIEVVSESLRYSPNSSYLLIGLGKLTVYKGLEAKRTGDEHSLRVHADRATEIVKKLRRVAGFRSETDATGGYVAYLRGDVEAARQLFDKAADIDPDSAYVRRGQALVRVRNLIDKALETMDPATGEPGDANGTATPGKDP